MHVNIIRILWNLHIKDIWDHSFYDIVQIVDSIMALFRVDFSGRGELADRQQKLAQMLSRLQKISEGDQLQSVLQKCLEPKLQLVLFSHHRVQCCGVHYKPNDS